ncbi:MAG: DUF2853 family protein [Planctomycetaceae bacterium]
MANNAETNLEKSKAQLEEMGVTVNDALLEKIVKGLGIANQSLDASLVSASDKSEVDRVRTNFLTKKLQQTDDAASDAAIAEVMEKMKEFKQKRRAAVYYLLTEKFSREDVYMK